MKKNSHFFPKGKYGSEKARILFSISKLFALIIFITYSNIVSAQGNVKFAVIGDFGYAGPNELAVANLIKSWNPEFIITLGDNNYEVGAQSTIDANIGQYFHEFIHPYIGIYGNGSTVNKFFPSLGNHDWDTPGAIPYLNYFVLPGNERYYDYIRGDVHFFVIDSDTREPDGVDSNSVQAQWLKNKLAQSSERWNVVYLHHPPYCSGPTNGSFLIMRWPYKRWGASTVLAGHEHIYERLNIGGLSYFVNGLGGRSRDIIGVGIPGSAYQYDSAYGAMLINSYNDSMVFKFYNVAGILKDNSKILPFEKILTLKVLFEGFYDPVLNTMISDTIKVYLRNNNFPYAIVDSAKGVLNSSGTGSFNFLRARNATDYYIVVKHRNSIETWSSSSHKFAANVMNYNFTTSLSQAFGNNLTLKGSSYCIFSGDINQDGMGDASDLSIVDNDVFNLTTGFIPSDVNGDNVADAADISITDNNVSRLISVIRP